MKLEIPKAYIKKLEVENFEFAGVSSQYEKPVVASLNIPTKEKNIDESSKILYNFVLPLISELR